ncbi:putative alpha-amylase [Paenibacillus sp. 598K]|uniref:DUF4838 domain-containing protein n=1 Tax=Paenibacillus sp. 598K TaxID=1117987 RepID=UPI000FF92DD8|nr:DUF4838 domain-containing protein [Paenibacillus sp. 598K]GBF74336.1 putative alpha-amylase [Paenibacillus sp. 598K]
MKATPSLLNKTLSYVLAVTVAASGILPLSDVRAKASASTTDNGLSQDAPLLVENGLPRAEIIIHSDADDMEHYAAEELQDTIKLVTGAELPIYVRDELLSEAVNVSLGEGQLEVAEAGNYDLSINFTNDDTTLKAVSIGAPAVANPFDVALNGGFSLAPGQTGSVTGSLFVPPTAEDGNYTVRFQPYVDNVVYGPELELTVRVKRNLLEHGGFEAGLSDGWYSPAGTAALDTDVKRSGEASYRLGADTGNTFNVRSTQSFETAPGSSYVLKAWMKGEKAGNAKLQLSEVVGYTQTEVFAVDAAVTTEWQPFTVNYTRNPSHQFDTNWIVMSFNQANGPGRLWIDDVTLVEAPNPPVEPTGPPAPGVISQGRFQIVVGTLDRWSDFTAIQQTYAGHLQGSDGFAVHSEGNRVFIVGDEPRGVLNGVYDFLEENAGVLWTRASEKGTLYEPQQDLALLKSDYWERSPLQVRGWLTLGLSADNEIQGDQATDRMLARNKNNARMSAHDATRQTWGRMKADGLEPIMLGHNLNYWLPNAEYFDDHPDYYNTDQQGNYIPLSAKTQFNFYHPDLPHLFAEKAKALIAATGTEYVGVGLNDNSSFYQAGLSDQPFTTEEGLVVQPSDPSYMSTVFFTFLNKMAREIKLTYPDAKVVAYAYTLTEEPPKTALEDNIIVVYAPLYEDARITLDTDDTSSANYRYKQQLEAWSLKTKNIIVYNYYGSFPSTDFERPIAEKVKEDVQFYRELGIMGVLPEGTIDSSNEAWGVNALQYWLMNKLFWNPDEDIEQLKTTFINKAYGAAADAMSTYYALLEQGWAYDDAQQTWATSGKTLFRQYIVRPGIRETARAALNEAYGLADVQAKARIAPIKEAFERMALAVGDNIDVSTQAIKTNYTKQQILSTFDFDAAPWSSVETPVTDFKHMQTGAAPLVDTKVYTLWDDDYLYIGYENFDPDVSLIRAHPTAPNEWWVNSDDDSVETYLLDGMGTGYYALMSNSLGVNIDYSGPEVSPAWNGVWESAAVVKQDRWVVIQAIPFSTINIASPEAGMVVMGHYFRNYHRTGSGLGLYGWDGGAVWNVGEFKPIILTDGPSTPPLAPSTP